MFDKVIMNPPYSGSLHLKILETVIKKCHKAEIVNLSPVDWLMNPYGGEAFLRYKNLNVGEIEYVGLLRDLFNLKRATYHLGIYHITSKVILPENYIHKFVLTDDKKPFVNEKLVSRVVNLLKGHDGNEAHIKHGPVDETTKWCFTVPLLVGNPGQKCDRIYFSEGRWKNVFYKGKDKDGRTPGETKKKLKNVKNYTDFDYIEFETEDEAWNWANAQSLKFMRFAQLIQSVDGHRRCDFTPYLDYTHPWTDKDLYEYFSLTEEEIAIIEKELTN